ncbi:hypothetical protein CGH44_17360, partial [Vibrio parahaemolyticus]
TRHTPFNLLFWNKLNFAHRIKVYKFRFNGRIYCVALLVSLYVLSQKRKKPAAISNWLKFVFMKARITY